jgi:hypothetical protein
MGSGGGIIGSSADPVNYWLANELPHAAVSSGDRPSVSASPEGPDERLEGRIIPESEQVGVLTHAQRLHLALGDGVA